MLATETNSRSEQTADAPSWKRLLPDRTHCYHITTVDRGLDILGGFSEVLRGTEVVCCMSWEKLVCGLVTEDLRESCRHGSNTRSVIKLG